MNVCTLYVYACKLTSLAAWIYESHRTILLNSIFLIGKNIYTYIRILSRNHCALHENEKNLLLAPYLLVKMKNYDI